MTCVENQVGLFQRQGVGSGIRPLFENLVADAPHDDARMVAVTFHQVGEITLMPLIKEAGIVAIRLLAPPHIKALVHHQEAHRVAHIEQFGCRRIMAATDGVDTHLTKDGQFAMHRRLAQGCAKTSEVMMLAHTIDFHISAIEKETLLGIKLDITETDLRGLCIHHLVVYQEFALDGIEIPLANIPKSRIQHHQSLFVTALFLVVTALFLVPSTNRALSYDLARSIQHGISHQDFLLALAKSHIFHLDFDITLRSGAYILSPLRDIGVLQGLVEPYMAVDATSRIPTAVRLVAIIDLHGDYIIAFLINIRCKVVLECAVAIRTSTQLMTIDIDSGVHIHAIESNGISVILILGIDGEMLAIPSDATRQRTAAGTRRIVGREVALYRPVVWEIEMTPCPVGIVALFHSHRICQIEKPSLVEELTLTSVHG